MLGTKFLFPGLLVVTQSSAEVVINELMAAGSDRQLVRETGGYPQVGNRPSWFLPSFDDGLWKTGPQPFGFGYPTLAFGTDLTTEMKERTPGLFLRNKFQVTAADAAGGEQLKLVISYNDGFIAFLNGVEVARRNMGNPGMFVYRDQIAFNHRAAASEETISLGPARDFLVAGENILSIQVHNHSLTGPVGDVHYVYANLDIGVGGSRLTGNQSWRYFVGHAEPSGGLIDYGLLYGFTPSAPDEFGEVEEPPDSESDWIELRNTSSSPVSLGGWTLSDDVDEPGKWTFPGNAVIPANAYLVVVASGLDLSPDTDGATYYHTNFKLSSDGEDVILSRNDGSVADTLGGEYPVQTWRYSYGRQVDGSFGYFELASPGGDNPSTGFGVAPAAPDFSVEGGFHEQEQTVALSSMTPGAVIRYSTDGSDPLEGQVYTTPLRFPSNGILRARSFLNGAIPSAPVTHTYLIGESAARQSLAAIALGGDPKLTYYGPNAVGGPIDGEGILAIKGGAFHRDGTWDDFGDTSAFNVPSLRGRSSEKNATLEYLPLVGEPLRTELGLRVSGSYYFRPRYRFTDSPGGIFAPRRDSNKPSFNMFFRSEFSKDPIEYPHFFPGNEVVKFENIRIRSGSNDMDNPFIRDEMMRRIFLATGQKGSIGVHTTLWINGVYKGYFNMTERVREAFMQQHFDSSEPWDIQQVNEFSDGNSVHWDSMFRYLRTTDLTTLAGYAGVHDYLDVDNFIDYVLPHAYAAMCDWPHNNWIASRERTPEGRWRFFMWDAEGAFGNVCMRTPVYNTFTEDLLLSDAEADVTEELYIPALYTLLKRSPEFRLRFADRAQKHLFNGGALVPARMTAIFEELRDDINPIMQDTIGETVDESFHDTWVVNPSRRDNFFLQLMGEGLWPSIEAPTASQHGGEIPAGYQLSLASPTPGGTVYYTMDGSDPRMAGGTVSPTAAMYTGAPVTLTTSTPVRARVLSGAAWGPEIDLVFEVPSVVATFIHSPLGETSRDWTDNANWTTDPAPYPDGPGVEVTIPSANSNRNVELRSPVTVGSILFEQGSSNFRSRIRDKSNGNTLTFSSPTGSRIVVEGSGAGRVEFDNEAGTILSNDLILDVRNLVGDPDHGALRLREAWSGSGGITKTGPGVASLSGSGKTFTGPVIISEGVLDFSQPSAPSAAASVTVEPGGQLRLTSGTDPGEADRLYTFGGDILLSGDGRSSAIASGAQNGRRGALRYDPGPGENRAILANRVQLMGASDIHVEGSGNLLTMLDSIAGSFALRKSGGGTLVLGGEQDAGAFPIQVEKGVLEIGGVIGSAVELLPDGVLRGFGSTAGVTGNGHLILPQTTMTAPTASVATLSLMFGKTGLPNFADSSASVNSALVLPKLPAGIDTLNVYLADPAPAVGAEFQGGVVVPLASDLGSVVSNATSSVFIPDVSGSVEFNGMKWAPLSSWTLTSVARDLPLSAPHDTARVLELRIGEGFPTSFDTWQAAAFPEASNLQDPQVSGPLAESFGEGVANLLRYAFGVEPGASALPNLPTATGAGGSRGIEFPFDSGRDDLVVRVQATSDPGDWANADILFDSANDLPPALDPDGRIQVLEPVSTVERRFFRVEVRKR